MNVRRIRLSAMSWIASTVVGLAIGTACGKPPETHLLTTDQVERAYFNTVKP